MSKRARIIVVLIGVSVCVLAALLVIFLVVPRIQEKKPRTLTMNVPWGADSGLEYVAEEVSLFEEVYPWLTVDLQTLPLGDMNQQWNQQWPEGSPDLAVVSDEVGTDQVLEATAPFLWTGSLWALYVNTKVTADLEGWNDGPPKEWMEGNVSIAQMEAVLAGIAKAGTTPISVGARFAWPLAAWLQHLALAEGTSETDLATPDGTLTETGAAALELWNSWVSQGWVVPDWKSEDWPSAVHDVSTGDAAFVLLGGNLVSSFPRTSDGVIQALPFPRGTGSDWAVGSIWSLAIPSDTAAPKQATLLFDFFTSAGVTGRLSRKFRTIFYSADGENQTRTMYASVTNQTDSPLMEYLKNSMR